jgi:hypothetical protein
MPSPRFQDSGLPRLPSRCLRRGLDQGHGGAFAQVRRQLRADRGLRPHRHLGRRPGHQAGQPQAGCGAGGRFRFGRRRWRTRPCRSAATRARSTRPTARPHQVFLEERRQGGRERHPSGWGRCWSREQLPDRHPSKKVSVVDYATRPTKRSTAQNTLVVLRRPYAHDAFRLIASRRCPVALKAKGASPELPSSARAARRDRERASEMVPACMASSTSPRPITPASMRATVCCCRCRSAPSRLSRSKSCNAHGFIATLGSEIIAPLSSHGRANSPPPLRPPRY